MKAVELKRSKIDKTLILYTLWSKILEQKITISQINSVFIAKIFLFFFFFIYELCRKNVILVFALR